jgi:hypothetical protein
MHTKTSLQQSSQAEQRTVSAQPGFAGQRTPGPLGAAGLLLSLQHSHGNRFVQRLLNNTLIQRDCGCGAACPDCGQGAQAEELDRPSLLQKSATLPTLIQAKLTVSQPGDPYEQEADRVAEEVMRMPAPAAAQSVHATFSPSIQRAQAADGEELAGEELVNGVISSPGQPLDSAMRGFFEPRFGHDFSQVRLHADDRAAESARAVKARAYTVGEHVVFGAQQLAPESTEGRRLMAHELTHVIQQGRADSTVVPEEESEDGDCSVTGEGDLETAVSTVSKHDPVFVGETDIARSATPKLSSGLMLQRADCPCCADGISISNITQIDTAAKMGHSFDVNMNLQYPANGPQGSCTLEWWEKTNVPAIPGHPADTWTEMFAFYSQSPTFDPWKNRAEACASSSPATITDPPALAKRPGRTVTRTLEFRIKVNSMPPVSDNGCQADSQQVTAKQVLVMVNGAPDWTASSFTTP